MQIKQKDKSYYFSSSQEKSTAQRNLPLKKWEEDWKTAIVSMVVTGDGPVSYWPIFFLTLSLVTVPGVFAKVNFAQFPSSVH